MNYGQILAAHGLLIMVAKIDKELKELENIDETLKTKFDIHLTGDSDSFDEAVFLRKHARDTALAELAALLGLGKSATKEECKARLYAIAVDYFLPQDMTIIP